MKPRAATEEERVEDDEDEDGVEEELEAGEAGEVMAARRRWHCVPLPLPGPPNTKTMGGMSWMRRAAVGERGATTALMAKWRREGGRGAEEAKRERREAREARGGAAEAVAKVEVVVREKRRDSLCMPRPELGGAESERAQKGRGEEESVRCVAQCGVARTTAVVAGEADSRPHEDPKSGRVRSWYQWACDLI